MRTRIALLVATCALVLPPVEGVASSLRATPTKKVSTAWKRALGPAVQADRWGEVQVLLIVKKKTTTIGKRKWVTRRITAVRLPVLPTQGASHTIGLNRKVLPLLAQQVLVGQFATKIEIISEATDTSVAFDRSLQAALANARRV